MLCTGRFNPVERDLFPILYEAGWIPVTVWRGAPSPGFDPHTVHPVAGRYIGYATLVNYHHFRSNKNTYYKYVSLKDGDTS